MHLMDREILRQRAGTAALVHCGEDGLEVARKCDGIKQCRVRTTFSEAPADHCNLVHISCELDGTTFVFLWVVSDQLGKSCRGEYTGGHASGERSAPAS